MRARTIVLANFTFNDSFEQFRQDKHEHSGELEGSRTNIGKMGVNPGNRIFLTSDSDNRDVEIREGKDNQFFIQSDVDRNPNQKSFSEDLTGQRLNKSSHPMRRRGEFIKPVQALDSWSFVNCAEINPLAI